MVAFTRRPSYRRVEMTSRTPFQFSYELAPSWPRLAWAALCENGSSSIPVIHGPGIDRAENWFCEAVWDGPFSEGNLDQTDLVFGSGARCRHDGVTFVSSTATADRLQVSVRGKRTFVSNSLPCLLAVTGARLDPAFRGYADLFLSVTRGLDAVPDLPLDDGAAVQFAYRTNLRWDGHQLRRVPKCAERRNFSCFHSYVGFLRAALQRIGENMASPQRRRAYSWLGTISRGYDSPASALLSREAGLRRVITINESRPGVVDDGSDIALALGLTCVVVGRLAWTGQEPLEPLFLVADGQGKEISIAGAAAELGHVVLVTGHGGDTAWSLETPYHKYAHPGTYSGMSMAEYRLHIGFIHMPCPFIGWSQLSDIVKLSRSDEMTAWSTGGTYNRPICRRLLEEAGVPRGSFAVSKTGASIRFVRGEDAWSKKGRRAFLAWLRTRPIGYAVTRRLLIEARVNMLGLAVVLRLHRQTQRFLANAFHRIAGVLMNRVRSLRLDDLAFVWAIQTVQESYSMRHHDEVRERRRGAAPPESPSCASASFRVVVKSLPCEGLTRCATEQSACGTSNGRQTRASTFIRTGMFRARAASPDAAGFGQFPSAGTQISMSRQRIASRIDLLTVPLGPDEAAGWKAYYQYQGSTYNADFLSCHASVLIPGHCPHPPHSHPEEEILLMLAGEAELILPSLRSNEGNQQPLRLKPGQFVYYPAHFHHTLRTVSTEPANYVMFKWRARPRTSGAQLQFGQFDAGDSCFPGDSATAFDYRLLFEGPTTCLELLHSHASRLAPGAENAPHSHSYETAMVVLEGEIETLGQRVQRHGLVFFSAGTPHGIRNPTSDPARYVVFEFHGRLPFWRKFIDPHWWGHRLHAVWNGG